MVLVGNKSDLLEIDSNPVKKEEAQKLADENEFRYFQTSALTGEQVTEMVESKIEAVYAKKVKPILLAEKVGQKTDDNIQLGNTQPNNAVKTEKCAR